MSTESKAKEKLPTGRNRMKGLPGIIFHIFLAGVVIFYTGCHEDRETVATASRELAAKLFSESRTAPVQKNEAAIRSKILYLDASRSIKGFAGKDDVFQKVTEKFGNEGFQLFKYGSNQKGEMVTEAAIFGQELNKPDFYNLSNNPDEKLIESLKEKSPDRLFVLLTDGVYSQHQGNSSSVVFKPITDWLGAGRAFGIFVFRSSFDKEVYSEKLCLAEGGNRLGGTGKSAKKAGNNCWVPLDKPVSRPFYAFVFSPTVEDYKMLRQQFKKDFPEMRSFLFGERSLSVTRLEMPEDSTIFDEAKPSDTEYYWQMFNAELFQKSAGPDAAASLTYLVDLEIDPELPVRSLDFRLRDTAYYRYNEAAATFEKTDSPSVKLSVKPATESTPFENSGTRNRGLPNPDAPAADSNRENSKPEQANGAARRQFVLAVPRDDSARFGFYTFQFRAVLEEMEEIVEQLSTTDDSVSSAADKTYRFRNLIEALINYELENQLVNKRAASFFMTLNYR